jgi:hypothetical protein
MGISSERPHQVTHGAAYESAETARRPERHVPASMLSPPSKGVPEREPLMAVGPGFIAEAGVLP